MPRQGVFVKASMVTPSVFWYYALTRGQSKKNAPLGPGNLIEPEEELPCFPTVYASKADMSKLPCPLLVPPKTVLPVQEIFIDPTAPPVIPAIVVNPDKFLSDIKEPVFKLSNQVIREIEKGISIDFKFTAACSLLPTSVEEVCENRLPDVATVLWAQLGGHNAYIHCLPTHLDSVLKHMVQCHSEHKGTT
jgi:hypothetical protein